MRKWCGVVCRFGLGALLIMGFSACAAKSPAKRAVPTPAYTETAMPTVAPGTPTPPPTEATLPTRPVGGTTKSRKGEAVGPAITHFGAARADGMPVEPQSVDKDGIPTYVSTVGSGFMIVVEAKPGTSNLEVARRIFAYVPGDPRTRPDLEIETNHDMGNGSAEVCDRRKPNIGGIPGINPPSFAETQRVSDAINDFGCRFETFIESDSSCTLTASGDYSFVKKDTTTQFCMMVARAYSFPVGDTLLSVRVRDTDGNPGPVKQMRIRRPASTATNQ